MEKENEAWLSVDLPRVVVRRVSVAVVVLRLFVVLSALLLAGVGLLGEDQVCRAVWLAIE